MTEPTSNPTGSVGMGQPDQPDQLDPDARYAAGWDQAWAAATAALTAAARLWHPRSGRFDFAGFLAGVLAGVAANVGGAEELLAGRPGSWEADLVDQLLSGTLGYDPDPAELIRRRTEPVTVAVNVATLVDNHTGGHGPFTDALTVLETTDTYTDAEEDALVEQIEQLHRDWTGRYQAYADRFTTAVRAAADQLGVTVPVTVATSTDPDDVYGELSNTEEPGWSGRPGDPLAWDLWHAALAAHPVTELLGPDPSPAPAPQAGSGDQPAPLPVAGLLPAETRPHQGRSG